MKQFLITAAGVFAGLVIFLIGVPFVLVAMAASAAASAGSTQNSRGRPRGAVRISVSIPLDM